MAEQADILKEHNWFIGEKKIFQYTIKDLNGAVVDITNFDLEWVLRPAAASHTIFIHKESTDPNEVNKTDPANGVCQVIIMPNDTILIDAAGTFFFTLKRADGDNDAVLAFGSAVLQFGATR